MVIFVLQKHYSSYKTRQDRRWSKVEVRDQLEIQWRDDGGLEEGRGSENGEWWMIYIYIYIYVCGCVCVYIYSHAYIFEIERYNGQGRFARKSDDSA